MADEETKDVKESEGQQNEESSNSEETTSNDSEVVENTEENDTPTETPKEVNAEQEAEDLLADGTPKNKKIEVEYDRFQEKNQKSELYDKFSPLLSKLNDNPELVEQLLKKEDSKETVEERIRRLESEQKASKRAELKTVLTDAINLYGKEFSQSWSELSPVVSSLEKAGVPTREAVQRAWFAKNPDAAQEEKRLVAKQEAVSAQNKLGTQSTSSGATKVVHDVERKVNLTDGDREIMRELGLTEEQYAKHADFIAPYKDL